MSEPESTTGAPTSVPGAEDRRRAAGDLGRAHIGLLTGPIAVGKTTVAERAVGLARRRGLSYGGLLAPAMQTRCGPKTGIWAVDLTTGDRRILARTDRTLGGPLVGAYSFDQAALDWSLQVVERAIGNCDLLVVDEIGKLELWQGAGLAPVLPRLAAGEAARALVVVRASLLADLQSRLGTARQFVFEVDEDNRGSLPAAILDALFAPDKTEV